MEPNVKNCRACGEPYPEDAKVCPRCRVPRAGDVNKRAILAYSFFLLLMLIFGWLTLQWAQTPR